MAELIRLGVTGLIANKSVLATVGNNVSNANTAGYTRQDAILETNNAESIGTMYTGTGVNVSGVRRIYDSFLTTDLRLKTDNLNRLDTYYSYSTQTDSLIADDSTSLIPSLQSFFSSLQTASDDPRSIPSRQAVLTQSQLLVNRFQSLHNTLDQTNTKLNSQITDVASQITTLAQSIAKINSDIGYAANLPEGQRPNDLLDKRDEALRKLSELVSTTVTQTAQGDVNVYIGNGQPLVAGTVASTLNVTTGEWGSNQYVIQLKTDTSTQDITGSLAGGKIGGILEYRKDILNQAYNQLGQIATGIMDQVNTQHKLGMDLDGDLGGNFFTDINSYALTHSRVINNANNSAPKTQSLSATIIDSKALTASDYQIEFPSSGTSRFYVTRLSDGVQVGSGLYNGSLPASVQFDGISVSLEAGTFAAGDKFLVQPTKDMSANFAVNVTNPRDIAFAQAISTTSGQGNTGTGQISAGQVLDTSTSLFSNPKKLSPPIAIQFTSATTYDVLDYSDPTNPVDLNPPMRNRTFIPGTANEIFSTDPNATATYTDGTGATVVRNGSATNGYTAGTATFSVRDPATGSVTIYPAVNITANETAANIAAAMNQIAGVKAYASSYAQLSNISSASPMTLSLNGQSLSGTTPAALVASINANTTLSGQGVTATTNGTTIEVRSSTGQDLQFTVGGGTAGDSINVTDAKGNTVTVFGNAGTPTATVGGRVDVQMSANVQMAIAGGTNVFSSAPAITSAYMGIEAAISGQPKAGDKFYINYNTDGGSDNRNLQRLIEKQTDKIFNNGTATISSTYGSLVEYVGGKTQEASLSKDAAQS
ncbi:MAG TPA: flagellar hook-associated protein FlgK, partial [Pseudomonadales bacterium]|nr:flagellar hook-associated protein FlgK [Pseudomonadales bacterium]